MTQPSETVLLARLLGDGAARKVSTAPGGWRSLSKHELGALGLSRKCRQTIATLQRLTERPYRELSHAQLITVEAVGLKFQEQLAALLHEVVIAVALDGRNFVLGEFEVARGGRHGAALTPADVLRPLIRAGASAAILVHNHPSGDPSPSEQDRELTRALRSAGAVVGIPLVDHVVVASRGGGYVSFLQNGLMEDL